MPRASPTNVQLDPDFHRGMKVGKYEVLRRLSVGGMAELFLAFTAGPGGFRKYVVVKRILPDVRENEHFVRMFLDEARITAAFSHPNIAQVFDLGEEEDGLYLAMEYIAGQNVSEIVRACADKRAVLPIGFSVSVARDVCLALHYAHTFADPTGRPFPVIHRDVTQKNVMVTFEGQVKLLDFGIAKARGSLGRTQTGTVKGTTGYMSPEQVRGEPLDARSDVFAVGVLLHELVTGRRLFSAEKEIDEMRMVLDGKVAAPVELEPLVPVAISDVVMKALAKEKTERFSSAKELARALEKATGKLLFDQDQRSAFMREHFEGELGKTHALLDSASDADADTGPFQPLPTPKRPKTTSAPKRAPSPPPALPTLTVEALESEDGPQAWSRLGWWMASIVVVVVLVTGFALVRLLNAPAESPLPPEVPRGASPAPVPLAEEPPPEPAPRPKSARQGGLTLVTLPAAKVYRGKQELGVTPLLNAPMPVGTHLLTLEGPDGKRRQLSVKIAAGKTEKFRLELQDIPEAP